MNPCKVCSNPTVRSQVDRMISEGISDDGISKSLASIGVTISKSAILRHRQNHAPETPPDGVEYPPDMVVHRRESVEVPPPMGDAAARLLAEIREKIETDNVDITTDRLVRETLLGRILESQLAITATALDRFQTGEGRYPLDMVKGLSTVGALFEKTVLHSTAVGETKAMLFEREIARRERLAMDEARTRVLRGEVVERVPHHLKTEPRWDLVHNRLSAESFQFGGRHISGEEFNGRIERAWRKGIAEALKQQRRSKRDEKRTLQSAVG